MSKPKQGDLILQFIQENGFIVPAHQSNKAWHGYWFGSELARACRRMRTQGILISEPEGKYEKFYINPNYKETVIAVRKEENKPAQLALLEVPIVSV